MTTPPVQNSDKEYIDKVEKDLLFEILWNIKNNKITLEEAKKISQDFLNLLPIQDKKDILVKLETLSNHYPPTRSLYLQYVTPHLEEERAKKIAEISQHIKSGDIEKALETAKGGTQNAG